MVFGLITKVVKGAVGGSWGLGSKAFGYGSKFRVDDQIKDVAKGLGSIKLDKATVETFAEGDLVKTANDIATRLDDLTSMMKYSNYVRSEPWDPINKARKQAEDLVHFIRYRKSDVPAELQKDLEKAQAILRRNGVNEKLMAMGARDLSIRLSLAAGATSLSVMTVGGFAVYDAIWGEGGEVFDGDDITEPDDSGESQEELKRRWEQRNGRSSINMNGYVGYDTILGGVGEDRIDGGAGNDTILGSETLGGVWQGSWAQDLIEGSATRTAESTLRGIEKLDPTGVVLPNLTDSDQIAAALKGTIINAFPEGTRFTGKVDTQTGITRITDAYIPGRNGEKHSLAARGVDFSREPLFMRLSPKEIAVYANADGTLRDDLNELQSNLMLKRVRGVVASELSPILGDDNRPPLIKSLLGGTAPVIALINKKGDKPAWMTDHGLSVAGNQYILDAADYLGVDKSVIKTWKQTSWDQVANLAGHVTQAAYDGATDGAGSLWNRVTSSMKDWGVPPTLLAIVAGIAAVAFGGRIMGGFVGPSIMSSIAPLGILLAAGGGAAYLASKGSGKGIMEWVSGILGSEPQYEQRKQEFKILNPSVSLDTSRTRDVASRSTDALDKAAHSDPAAERAARKLSEATHEGEKLAAVDDPALNDAVARAQGRDSRTPSHS